MFSINFIQAVYISAGYKKTLGFFEKKEKISSFWQKACDFESKNWILQSFELEP